MQWSPEEAVPQVRPSPLPAAHTLTRAQAFIRAHAAAEMSVVDFAAAMGITARTLQYAFARQGGTPLHYLRRVRLAGR